ncbi:hypothetical protein CFIO01_04034 [Colletotrichum fioriniae PJ7]|uniref:Uncharacterized protein n=1 Tax=Colletotrichum fioriniae PJ7 TaxID=1445577 RepID=A0A010RHB4_9PEZI|nr:hypothetical protein CFIO01_04034 [Colletotrichum fioriniae PJ7]
MDREKRRFHMFHVWVEREQEDSGGGGQEKAQSSHQRYCWGAYHAVYFVGKAGKYERNAPLFPLYLAAWLVETLRSRLWIVPVLRIPDMWVVCIPVVALFLFQRSLAHGETGERGENPTPVEGLGYSSATDHMAGMHVSSPHIIFLTPPVAKRVIGLLSSRPEGYTE